MRTHAMSVLDRPIAKSANKFSLIFHVAPKHAGNFSGLFRNFLTRLFVKRPVLFGSASDVNAVVVFLNFSFHWLNYSTVGSENAFALIRKLSLSAMIMLATLVLTSRKF